MSLVTGQIAILFEFQPVEGTLAPGLAAILAAPPASLADTDGLVLGVDTLGVGDSGIDYTLARVSQTAGTQADGLTRKFDAFRSVDVSTLSVAFPISGTKIVTTTPTDGELGFLDGIQAIYRSCGLGEGVGGGGPNYKYTPAACDFASCLIFDSGTIYPFIDLKGSLAMDYVPGERGVQVASFTSKLVNDDVAVAAFPTTLDYGDQDDVAAPIVELSGSAFGPVRGWSALSITVDNQIETTPDSNALDGARIEQAGREISFTATMDIDSTDVDFDYQNLVAAVAQTDALAFTIFGATTPGARALGYTISINAVNLQEITPDQPARARSLTMTGFATSTVDAGEFSLDFI